MSHQISTVLRLVTFLKTAGTRQGNIPGQGHNPPSKIKIIVGSTPAVGMVGGEYVRHSSTLCPENIHGQVVRRTSPCLARGHAPLIWDALQTSHNNDVVVGKLCFRRDGTAGALILVSLWPLSPYTFSHCSLTFLIGLDTI
jgi:hypothetical protein